MRRATILFAFISLKVIDLSKADSGDDDEQGGIALTIFWSVVTAAFIGGAILGAVLTAVFGILLMKQCCGTANEGVQFNKETDLNQSKRYLRSEISGEILDESTVHTPQKPKPPLKPSASQQALRTDNTSKSEENKKPIPPLKPNSSTANVPVSTSPNPRENMRRSISLGGSALTTAAKQGLTDPESQGLDEGSTEHYYTCDIQNANKAKKQSRQQASGTKDKKPSAHGIKQSGQSHDDGPQYCNVGIKLKEGGNSSTTPASAIQPRSVNSLPSKHSTTASEYQNIKSRRK